MKRLIFLTLADLRANPFPEVALPALARSGWDVTIAGPNAHESAMARALPFPCRRFEIGASELSVQRWLQTARLGPYDVIYLHSQGLAVRAAVSLLGPLFGKRLLYHTFDFYDPAAHPIHSLLEGMLARRADCHWNGEYHRGYFCRSLYRLRCPVVVVPPYLPAAWPVPAQSADVRRKLGARAADDVVLMLHGGRSRLRATDQLLEALAMLPNRFRLAMTGSRAPELSALLDRLQIAGRVTCLGRLDYGELFSHTVNADIGIMLHGNNDLGNFFQNPGRLTEYMACGLPVLASHFTGLQLLAATHRIGLCADPESPADIAARLIDIETALRQGAFGRDAIRKCFLEHFAFDHWEKTVVECAAFLALNPRSSAFIGG